MNNFFKRTFTAILFVLILLGCTYYNQLSFVILFLAITIIGSWEFYKLAKKNTTDSPQKILGTLSGAILFLSNALVCMNYVNIQFLFINIPFLFILFIIELFSKASQPFQNIANTLLGIVYVALPFSLLNYLLTYTGTYNYEILFGFFFILWTNDTGAYIVGSAIGKHKLFARVSPGKTWEGTAGGALISYGVVLIISNVYTSINTIDWFAIATILIIMGTLGDLVESLYKRSKNVKDSGNILPGHGGILDRFDSLLMATPFVFTYLYFIKFFHL